MRVLRVEQPFASPARLKTAILQPVRTEAQHNERAPLMAQHMVVVLALKRRRIALKPIIFLMYLLHLVRTRMA